MLAGDVQLLGDAGGKAPLWGAGIVGADNVARVLATVVPPFIRIGGTLEPLTLNGQPGLILGDRQRKIINTLTLDIADGQIQLIRAVLNPDKLGHLGPVADAVAVLNETRQAQRSADPATVRQPTRPDTAPATSGDGRRG